MKYDREKMAHWLAGWRQSGQTVSSFANGIS
jgi:ribosome modulation factor